MSYCRCALATQLVDDKPGELPDPIPLQKMKGSQGKSPPCPRHPGAAARSCLMIGRAQGEGRAGALKKNVVTRQKISRKTSEQGWRVRLGFLSINCSTREKHHRFPQQARASVAL